MAVREDVAKTVVIIDGKQGLNELGKLELKKNDIIKSLKGMKKETDEYVKKNGRFWDQKATKKSLQEWRDLYRDPLRTRT